jgi:hypothetical protein
MPAALVYALPEIGASFPLFWPAIGAVLLLYAITIIFRNPLVHVLEAIPVIGGAAAKAVYNAANWAISYVEGWADTLVWPLIQVLLAPAAAITAFVGATVGTLEDVMDRVRITAQAANGEFGQVAQNLGSLTNTLGSALVRLGAVVTGLAAANATLSWIRYTQVPATNQQAVAESAGYARVQVGAEAQTRAGADAQVRAETLALHQAEVAARRAADEQAAAAAAASAAALSIAITQAAAKGEHYTDIKTAAAAAVAAAATAEALAQAKAVARAEAKVVADELAAVRLACIDPLCGAFGPAAALWSQLAQGAELLLLLGLVEEGVRDPQGAARNMAGLVDGVYSTAAGMLSPFIGRA